MKSSVTVPAHAKVNLFLDVVGKRSDGYHELVTLFERIDLADELVLERIPGGRIEVECDHPDLPRDGSNLVARAAEAYRKASGWEDGVRIRLKKRIPVAAGLGGGSSDAASTLQGMRELTGRSLPETKWRELARGLGSDVPFFLGPGPFALGRGRGDELEPVTAAARLWHLLVFPGFPVPTKSVYQAFRLPRERRSGQAFTAWAGLTPSRPDVTLLIRALRDRRVPQIVDRLFNALEPTVERLYPALRRVKAVLKKRTGLAPRVSGSGSTVMAVCASRAEAEAAAQLLKKEEPDWQLFVAATRD